MIAVELVAVHPFEHNALSVDLHQSVPDAELTESDTYAHNLMQNIRRITHTNQNMIEPRALRAPQEHTGSLARKRMRLCGDDRLISPYTVPVLITEQDLDVLLGRIAKRKMHIKLPIRISIPFKRHGTNSNILDVVLRLGIEQNIAIDPREPPKILILKPARARIAEHHRRQLILARHKIRCQIEVRRCAAVLTVADEMPIEEECECRIHAAKGYKNIFPVLRHGEILHIAADGVAARRNLPRRDALVSVPRIRRIRIMRYAVPLHLDVRRHMDRLPVVTVVVRRLKALRDACCILRIGKVPNTAERAVERGYAACQFHLITIEDMIAVR